MDLIVHSVTGLGPKNTKVTRFPTKDRETREQAWRRFLEQQANGSPITTVKMSDLGYR